MVATATNQASGDGEAVGLSFSPISYTTDALEQMVADGIATRAADGSWVIPIPFPRTVRTGCLRA